MACNNANVLSVFVRTERLTAGQALALLEKMSSARSWNENSYVQRARSLLDSS
jgi:hypothetical protein